MSPAGPRLDGAADLARGLCDLKAVRDAHDSRSVADRLFLRAWAALVRGDDADAVAAAVSARALAAISLGAIDIAVLADAGLAPSATRAVLVRALHAAPAGMGERVAGLAGGFDTDLSDVSQSGASQSGASQSGASQLGASPFDDSRLDPGLADDGMVEPRPPAFAVALTRQDRAGATAPGKPRIMLPAPESHGGHCLAVAVLGLLIAEDASARTTAFLAGLAHHLHNAALPDAGFAGEMLLGAHLDAVMARFRERALDSLPAPLSALLRQALADSADAGNAAGRAFHAADVIDRVAQMGFHARAGAFRVAQATGELGLVHEGPLQAFHLAVLGEAGLSEAPLADGQAA